jgi:50S ribosome-binding GTPase
MRLFFAKVILVLPTPGRSVFCSTCSCLGGTRIVAGKTGVGKSTLINAVFQGNFASTGQGRPATRNTRRIKKKGVPLYIFDTRGLELDRFLESLEELEDLICGLAQSEDPNEHIHCAWLCISEDGRRIEDPNYSSIPAGAASRLITLSIELQMPVGTFN